MFLTSWLCDLREELARPYRRNRRRRVRSEIVSIAAAVENLEARLLLSNVLVDTTPTLTVNAIEGHSTGNLVLATFTDTTAPPGLFTNISPPGSLGVEATGISGNNVVGTYWGAKTGMANGFLYDGSTFTTIDPPGAIDGVYLTGISGNNIVGWYKNPQLADGALGFLYDASTSTYTILQPPGSTSTEAIGVSGNNVLGLGLRNSPSFIYYNTATKTYTPIPIASPAAISGDTVVGLLQQYDTHGILYKNGVTTTFDVPGTNYTNPTAISGNNVVGIYAVNSDFHSFLWNGTTFNTSFDPPGADFNSYPLETGPKGIDGSDVVGIWLDPQFGTPQGYLYNGSTTTILKVPGADTTSPSAVSNGNVVGSYFASVYPFFVRAFLYQPGSIQAGFVPSVDWGGPLAGTPTISVQLVSQNATSSTWKVMGSATYLDEGTHAVAVSVNDGLGNSIQTNKITLNVVDAPLVNTTPPATHTAVEGNSTGNMVLATFTDYNPSATPVDYNIPISWGGFLVAGSTPTASLVLVSRTENASTWQVVGSAMYATRGTDTISLSVIDRGGSTLSSIRTTVNVADAPLADATPSTTRNIPRRVSTGNVVVATFTDADPFALPSELAASVNWGGALVGRSTVSIQLVSRSASASTWQVIASAAYRNRGVYLVAVTISDQEGMSLTSKKSIFVVV